MKVRRATKEMKDFEAFDKLYYRTEYSYEMGKISEERTEESSIDPPLSYEHYCSLLDFGFEQYYLLENDDRNIIGSANLAENEIKEFVIDRNYQLQGFGRVFYNLLENMMKARKEKEILLTCYFPGAAMFWDKMGFKNQGLIFINEYIK